MRGFKKLSWISLLGLALLVVPGCTDSDLDDPDTGNVVLEILNIDNPAITGDEELGTCTNPDPGVPASGRECLTNFDCPEGEFCDLPASPEGCTITEWTANMANVPKTDLATTQPFNDMVVKYVDITYRWADGEESERTANLGVTIPAGSTASATFWPITPELLRMDTTTVQLDMRFHAQTLDGEDVNDARSGSELFIENCLPAAP